MIKGSGHRHFSQLWNLWLQNLPKSKHFNWLMAKNYWKLFTHHWMICGKLMIGSIHRWLHCVYQCCCLFTILTKFFLNSESIGTSNGYYCSYHDSVYTNQMWISRLMERTLQSSWRSSSKCKNLFFFLVKTSWNFFCYTQGIGMSEKYISTCEQLTTLYWPNYGPHQWTGNLEFVNF